jgi:hypothetical protein
MGAPSRTFSALQQKPHDPNLVILIFCRIPMGIRIGLNRWLNQLVPGYEHSPTRFSQGTIWLKRNRSTELSSTANSKKIRKLVLMGTSC